MTTKTISTSIMSFPSPVWSLHACKLCKVIEKAKPKKTRRGVTTRGDVKNPIFCEYDYVKIDGILYHRYNTLISTLKMYKAYFHEVYHT